MRLGTPLTHGTAKSKARQPLCALADPDACGRPASSLGVCPLPVPSLLESVISSFIHKQA